MVLSCGNISETERASLICGGGGIIGEFCSTHVFPGEKGYLSCPKAGSRSAEANGHCIKRTAYTYINGSEAWGCEVARPTAWIVRCMMWYVMIDLQPEAEGVPFGSHVFGWSCGRTILMLFVSHMCGWTWCRRGVSCETPVRKGYSYHAEGTWVIEGRTPWLVCTWTAESMGLPRVLGRQHRLDVRECCVEEHSWLIAERSRESSGRTTEVRVWSLKATWTGPTGPT